MDVKRKNMLSIQQQVKNYKLSSKEKKQEMKSREFNSIFQDKIEKSSSNLKFSKHATGRLKSRNISFSREQLDKIQNGIDKAEKKGVRDSLVLIDNVALVVNVKNKTVITAIDQNETEENIFTNIDGAVLL